MGKAKKSSNLKKRVSDKEPQSFQVPLFRSYEKDVTAHIRQVKNPAPHSSFGFASECFSLEPETPFQHGFLTLPVDLKLIQQRQISITTLRLFHWDQETKSFQLVEGSGIDPDWRTVSGHIMDEGMYALIGLSANPWIRSTIEMLWLFQDAIKAPEVREMLVPPICGIVLCQGPDFQNTMDDSGLPGLPPGLEGMLCNICLNGRVPELGLLDIDEQEIPIRRKPIDRIPLFNLDDWLTRRPGIANAIVWREPGPVTAVLGVPKTYSNWTQAQKLELADKFTQTRFGWGPNLSNTPAITLNLHSNGELFSAELQPSDAWQYFLAYVAQSLAAEVDQWVPWSLSSYSVSELEALLDSHSLFEYSSTLLAYGVLDQHPLLYNHGAAMPGNPSTSFAFLRSNNLIAANPRSTIENLLEWCRTNLSHFYGDFAPANLQAHWQYDGWPPIDRIINGTTHPQFGFAHWTAGCTGTTGFLRAVLRTCNIPVKKENRCGHALPAFMHEGLYLSHGDDPYNWFAKATPPIPIGQLLINQTTFDSWFGPNVAPGDVCSAVGRRVRQLAVQYLPNQLLRMHCQDTAAGLSPAQSSVYNQSGLALDYTLNQLITMGLWTQMDAKIAAFGGCSQIPYP